MITRDNFNDVINSLNKEDKTKIKESLYDYEYAKVRCSSYGHVWLAELTNDLPPDYDEQISDGTTYFLSVEEITGVL